MLDVTEIRHVKQQEIMTVSPKALSPSLETIFCRSYSCLLERSFLITQQEVKWREGSKQDEVTDLLSAERKKECALADIVEMMSKSEVLETTKCAVQRSVGVKRKHSAKIDPSDALESKEGPIDEQEL